MKKSIKKIILLMAVVVTALVCFAFSASALDATGQCGDDVYWTFDESTGELVISGEGEMWDYVDDGWASGLLGYDINSVIIDEGVTTIGDLVFYRCNNLKSVIIPETVMRIGLRSFFECKNLIKIKIPDSVTEVGREAFLETGYYKNSSNWEYGALYIGKHLLCVNSEISDSYKIKEGTLTIADAAFENLTNITNVEIPNSVVTIGAWAFSNCSKLSAVNIPHGVVTIGDRAFYFCKELRNIVVPDSVTAIGNLAFLGTAYYNNANNWESGLFYMGNHLVKAENDVSGNYNIKESTLTIASNAFSECKNITKIIIPNNVKTIGNRAFSECVSLASITIPNSVQTIGEGAFAGCYSLESVIIPYGINRVENETFLGCENLKELTIPDTVRKIEKYAFADCKNLTTIKIPENIKLIGKNAFFNCCNLKTIKIPNNVSIIGDEAFAYCSELISIEIGSGVKRIGEGAFRDCCSLAGIIVNEKNQNYSSDMDHVLFNKDKTTLIQYPIGNERSLYIVPNSVTKISDYAFSGCTNIIDIIISDNVTTIGYGVFYGCRSITDIIIPNKATEIYNSAFAYCDSLESVIIPDGITEINSSMFFGCSSLMSVTIPKSVTRIGMDAFAYCSKLKVFYCGTEKEWTSVFIEIFNEDILNAPIIFLGNDKVTDGNITECAHENKISYIQQAPTCEEVGYTEGEYCPDCEIWLVEREEISESDHDYKFVEGKDSTCSVNGYKTYICSRDSDHGYTEILDKLPHTETHFDGKEPTCTEPGWRAYVICTVCGYSSYDEIDALGHKEIIQPAVNATCVKTGLTEGRCCSVCSEILVAQQTIGKTGHSFTEYISDKNATYSADGTKTAKCDNCTETDTVMDVGSKLKLEKPSGITVTQNNSVIKLTWKPAKNATGYRIYYKTSIDGDWVCCAAYTTAKTYTFKKLSAGEKLYIAVRSVGKETDSALVLGAYEKIETSTVPTPPTTITATQTTSTITLNWSASKGATGYRVYQYSPSKGKYVVIASIKGKTTYTKTKNLKAGSQYKFKIKPYIKLTDGTVIWGSASDAFTTATKPKAPTKVTATTTKTTITLNWSASAGATGYRVYQYSPSKGKYVVIESLKGKTSYKKSKNLKAGKEYKFKIKPYVKFSDGTVIWGSASSAFAFKTKTK